MQTITIRRNDATYPEQLTHMHQPPARIYVRGAKLADLMQRPRVAIVGSRRMSAYGKHVTQQFATALAEQGVVIVSGLAYGVDAQAHTSALRAGGLTLAVLPSPVESPLPAANIHLAERIVENGGALLSSYPAGSESHKGNFVARNEVVAALSDIILITEATITSGTRHTADFAQAMGIEVLAVPGDITNPISAGTNQFIAANRAGIAPSVEAVMQKLGLKTLLSLPLRRGDTPDEQQLIDLIAAGIHDGSQLLEKSGLPVQLFNQALTMLEISGKVLPLGGNQWGLP